MNKKKKVHVILILYDDNGNDYKYHSYMYI